MSDAYEGQPRLAAWLQVERASLLDRRLAQPDAAKAALLRGLERDRRIGPVRASCVRHAVVHRDAAWLVALLAEEASLEGDPARAAALELDAACVARRRLGDARAPSRCSSGPRRACPSRRRSTGASSTSWLLSTRARGGPADVLRVRRLRLTHLDDVRARAHEHRGHRGARGGARQSGGGRARPSSAPRSSPPTTRRSSTSWTDASRRRRSSRSASSSGPASRRPRRPAPSARAAPAARPRAGRRGRDAGAGRRAGARRDRRRPRGRRRRRPTARLAGLVRAVGDACPAEVGARIAAHAHGAESAPDERAARRASRGDRGPARRAARRRRTRPPRRTRRSSASSPGGASRSSASRERRRGRATPIAWCGRCSPRPSRRPTRPRRTRCGCAPPRRARRSTPSGRWRSRADVLARAPGQRRRPEPRAAASRGGGSVGAGGRVARRPPRAGRRRPGGSRDRRLVAGARRAAARRACAPRETRSRRSRRPSRSIRSTLPPARRSRGSSRPSATRRSCATGLAALAAATAQRARRARDGSRGPRRSTSSSSSDDASAAGLYARAREAAPESAWLEDRELRVLAPARAPRRRRRPFRRRSRPGSSGRPATPRARSTSRSSSRRRRGPQTERATALIEEVLAADPTAPHALRALERIARATGRRRMMANALAQQAEAFADDAPKLGALLGRGGPRRVEAPRRGSDRGHRRASSSARRRTAPRSSQAVRLAASARARGRRGALARASFAALRAQLSQATGETERLCAHLALGVLLEPRGRRRDEARGRAALLHYRKALEIDARSVVAARGSRAPRRRAARCRRRSSPPPWRTPTSRTIRGAGPPTSCRPRGRPSPRQGAPRGTRSECLARAGEMLERALAGGPRGAARRGAARRGSRRRGERAATASSRRFAAPSSAPGRTQVVVQLGTELARLAAIDPPDRLLAVDALRRVLGASPGHLPALRALADHCAAMEAWGDAVDALEPIAAGAREPRARLAALFDLADVFGPKLARPADVERVLRPALDVDPMSVEALRRLLAHRRADGAAASRDRDVARRASARRRRRPRRRPRCSRSWPSSCAARATPPAPRRPSSRRRRSRRRRRASSRLAGLFTGAPSEHARALNAVVARGRELDRPDAGLLRGARAARGRRAGPLGRRGRAPAARRRARAGACTRRAPRWRAG